MTWVLGLKQELVARAFHVALVLICAVIGMGLLMGVVVMEIWTALDPRWGKG